MSLRLKLIVVFGAILTITAGIAAYVGAQRAESAVENAIRQRAKDVGKNLALDLTQSKTFDRREAGERMDAVLRGQRGLNSITLAVEQTGANLILRKSLAPSGVQTEQMEGTGEIPRKASEQIVDSPEGRFWSVVVPLHLGRSKASLTLEASLADADQLVATEKRVFLQVGAFGLVILILAANLVIGQLIGRPISSLATAMAQVDRGQLEVTVPLGAGDEFDRLAHGFNTMLERIRGFNRELTQRIEEATTDLARKNRTLAELNDLLVAARRDLTAKERLAALGQLAGTIAHELGNPLNSISGHVQLLEQQSDLPESVRIDLATVSAEVRRMTGVIRRFLDSTGGLRPAPEEVDLRTLLHEALDMSLSADARARLEIRIAIGSGLARAVTDPSLVRHVLTNLIANAVDAMPGGGELRLDVRTEGPDLALSVQDSGSGISPEERRRIFEPFYTTKPRGKGTGLGLAICREIARALKGRIDVESALGHGSTFTLWIPYQPGSEPKTAEAWAPSPVREAG